VIMSVPVVWITATGGAHGLLLSWVLDKVQT
jgi:hypothetical protein